MKLGHLGMLLQGCVEVHETTSTTMALQLQTLLEKIGLMHYVIALVKDEVNNLGTMVTTLESTVDCEPLKFFWVYEGFCFG
jgi:hypothetical protein